MAVPMFEKKTAVEWEKLDVPHHEQRRLAKETQLEEMKKALASIEKLLKVKKALFVGGPNGLQAKHARSIQSYLTMVIKKKCLSIDVSQRAAESHGFAANWGGHQVCSWTRLWVADHRLPESLQGQHAKVYSLLGDPTIATELRTYAHSKKWVINPEKLIQLSQDRLIPAEATKYAQKLVEEEMPHGQGLHQSDVISSMVGHLVEAGETMEYGKNHEGYWCGENFCTQLTEKIIPTFEHACCPRYQALFLIDNSQGHSAYAEDALLVSCMNIHPGWKQANMWNG
ncbi:uncharacterized protein BJ212DRAFT_1450175 [Suillus subaureus]|uniref:DDE-1 domain-containing protein n=1 Tax=Suillus subaureus TaxID=48587 RepID=A0A9P7DPT8_9AGAM|nr:uncharacterized protein BJ212DRAFT_1450175 [Suillus subaureus]KAG1800178.1 hypothetical protein BJ212DRAFT_1450175 [Suillus subaureus]